MRTSRVGKLRYRVAGPTPASFAMRSSVASRPSRANMTTAVERILSRLRWASARSGRPSVLAMVRHSSQFPLQVETAIT
jgi:hypothetical protein